MRKNVLVITAGLLLASHLPAFAIGDITCETPDVAGVVGVVPLTADPRDDVSLMKVGESDGIDVGKIDVEAGGGEVIDHCIIGPLPPVNTLQGAGSSAPSQAYIEHGLAESASWQGFRFELALPEAGLPEGADFVLLSVDLDTAAGPAGEYRIAVRRGVAGAELVLFDAGGSSATGSSVPIGSGPVTVHWTGGGFVLSHGGASVSAPLAPGARARTVRMGYLGLNEPQGALGELYVVDPALVSQ